MHRQRDVLPEGLREIIALAEDRFPGDIKRQYEWLRGMVDYVEIHKVCKCGHWRKEHLAGGVCGPQCACMGFIDAD